MEKEAFFSFSNMIIFGSLILLIILLLYRHINIKNDKKTTHSNLNKTIFSFMGAPGSGKGTLAEQCGQKLGFQVLSTGNLCREHIAKGTELGEKLMILANFLHIINASKGF